MFCQEKSAFLKVGKEEQARAKAFCEGYKEFLDKAKTEREAVDYARGFAKANGFAPFESGAELKAGDRVYLENRGKAMAFAVIGEQPMEQGVNIIAAHVDSPRLDLKQNPIYEDSGLALFKTHYYGGIKKYQWMAIPLALHGVAVTKTCTVKVSIGEDASEPVFTITDLLPHLAEEQMKKKASEFIEGEALNILIGSEISMSNEQLGISNDGGNSQERISDSVKKNILVILKQKYGIEEEDFVSSELCIVPAGGARDVGLDCSFVGGYGQDDRVCSYTALTALASASAPKRTAVLFLADKEEVGSMGNTGMKSTFFYEFIRGLAPSDNLHIILSNSQCLSADVGAAWDPTYKDVMEKNNAPQLNHGLMISKYAGSRGKSGSSDANAEFVGKVRNIFNEAGVAWQTGELGKVDAGGGGTVAQYIANLNVDVLDCGVPLLSMHSPFEIAAKLDIYMAYKGYSAFYKS
ncbi:MAG: aminopeptidase [Oscillospiraceae bacterium]|nr:aminopeptidase [Oscillospiraceae bacterium]